jgi:signal transduction histidine kinase
MAQNFRDLSIKFKMFIIVIGSIISSALLIFFGTLMFQKFQFEKSTLDRLILARSFIEMSFAQMIGDTQTGINALQNDLELTRDTLNALGTPDPLRKNFYKLLFTVRDKVHQYRIDQASLYLKPMGNPNFQIYGTIVREGDHVFSFSTRFGEEGQNMRELERSDLGFISVKDNGLTAYDFKFPLEFRTDDAAIKLTSFSKKLYLDFNYPIVNQFIGTDDQSAFAHIGLKYGMMRSLVEISPALISEWEKKTGVKISFFSIDWKSHLAGSLAGMKARPDMTPGNLFDIVGGGKSYISYPEKFKIAGNDQAYILLSIPKSDFINDLLKMSLVIFTIIALITGGIIFILKLFLTKSISEPLLKTINAVENISHGHWDTFIDDQSGDELGVLARSVNKMQKDLAEAFNTISEQNRTLERKVAERTHELQVKTNDITAMLQNMKQGILTVTAQNRVHHEYSSYLENILESSGIAGENVVELLFTHSNIGDDLRSQISSALLTMIGEDQISFELNKSILPRECQWVVGTTKKTLEMDWAPILSEGVVDKILVTIRDVTELRKLQDESTSQKRELQMISEILAVSRSEFNRFIESTQDFLKENSQLILRTKEKDDRVIAQLFRNMHTIKGNARTFGFHSISDAVHRAEQTYDGLRLRQQAEWNSVQLVYELKMVEELINKYKELNEIKLGNLKQIDDGVILDRNLFQKVCSRIHNINATEVGGDLQQAIDDVKVLFDTADTYTVRECIDGLVAALPGLAIDLGKEPPKVEISNAHLRVSHTESELLKNVLMHTLRNALDHGIESKEERKAVKKSPIGQIVLSFAIHNDLLTVCQKDDGRGLDIATIRERAIEKGLIDAGKTYTIKEIAELIFISGMTTSKVVSHISGRGVGMDAIRLFVEEKGGHVELVLDAEDLDARFIPFYLNIFIPRTHHQDLASQPGEAAQKLA